MKTLFFSSEELNQMVSELYHSNFVKVGFDEDMEVDVVEWYDKTMAVVQDVTFFDELITLLNKRFNINIKEYDAVEYPDLGVGFQFIF